MSPGSNRLSKYVTIEQIGADQFRVNLKVGNQSFCVTPSPSATKSEADWMARMLRTAVGFLIEDQRNESLKARDDFIMQSGRWSEFMEYLKGRYPDQPGDSSGA